MKLFKAFWSACLKGYNEAMEDVRIALTRSVLVETIFVSYADAEKFLAAEPETRHHSKWRLSKKEDGNKVIGFVYLEREWRGLD